MRTFVNFFAFGFFLLTLLFNSCKQQSEVNLNDCYGKARITGVVQYKAGFKNVNGVYVDSLCYAVGQTVYVVLDASNLDSDASGEMLYEAIVDENGFYSIEVPFGVKSVKVDIKVKPFTADVTFDNTLPELNEAKNVLFGTDYIKSDFSLENGQTYVNNIVLDFQEQDFNGYDGEYTKTIKVSGSVNYVGWVSDGTDWDSGNVKYAEKPLYLSVLNDYEMSTKHYRVVTDANGEFTYDVPCPIFGNTFVTVTSDYEYIDDSFKHYFYDNENAKWQYQITSVYYKTEEDYVVNTVPTQDGLVAEKIYCTFYVYPVSLYGIYGIGADWDFDNFGYPLYTGGTALGWRWN